MGVLIIFLISLVDNNLSSKFGKVHFKIYPVYSVAGCHKGGRLQQVGFKSYVIQLYGKCITILVTLSNLFFVILRPVVMTVHLRIYFYTLNLLRFTIHTHSLTASYSTVTYCSSIPCLHVCHLREPP